jgi:predicted metalloprotease
MAGAFGGGHAGLPQYGPAPQMPRPPQRNLLKRVLLVLIALCVVAIAGLVIASVAGSDSEVAYQNDDFTVPPPDTAPTPIPRPQTEQEAEDFLLRNPFYDQTAPIPVRCNSQPINVATATDEQLDAHFNGLMECLVRVWQPPVTRAGFVIVRPTVTIYGAKITTKCGTSDVNAFYCSADQQVYFSNQLADYVKIVAQDKWAADVVMAHEFGHALQGRTGILISSAAMGQLSDDKSTELLYSRRSETQADCFSGMFMRAVSRSLGIQQSDVAGIIATFRAVGDDTLTQNSDVEGSHGLAASRFYWGNTGLGTSDVGKCNTFSAPASQVR